MSTDGSLDQFFGFGRRHKLLERILIPCDIGKLVNTDEAYNSNQYRTILASFGER